jgi:hypothetical protein
MALATPVRVEPLRLLRRRAGPVWLALAVVELCVLLGGAHWLAFAGGRQMLTQELHRLLVRGSPLDQHRMSGHHMSESPGSAGRPTHASPDH